MRIYHAAELLELAAEHPGALTMEAGRQRCPVGASWRGRAGIWIDEPGLGAELVVAVGGKRQNRKGRPEEGRDEEKGGRRRRKGRKAPRARKTKEAYPPTLRAGGQYRRWEKVRKRVWGWIQGAAASTPRRARGGGGGPSPLKTLMKEKEGSM
ncbi:hypothetical protein KM043_000220 [Ampulex compressa]|nr:hypothetical protein KM043_000220 [Ampulex compressa]